MVLTKCKECGGDLSDKAFLCPHCGIATGKGGLYGYEYRSETEILGLPLVHIATGMDPSTGRKRIAKGIIAMGDISIGVLSLGGVAMGGITFGGCSLGFFSLGGLAIGILLALGGMAIGSVAIGGGALGIVAIGGGAVGYYALGGGAFGAYALGGNAQDPEAIEFFRAWLGSWIDQFIVNREQW